MKLYFSANSSPIRVTFQSTPLPSVSSPSSLSPSHFRSHHQSLRTLYLPRQSSNNIQINDCYRGNAIRDSWITNLLPRLKGMEVSSATRPSLIIDVIYSELYYLVKNYECRTVTLYIRLRIRV